MNKLRTWLSVQLLVKVSLHLWSILSSSHYVVNYLTMIENNYDIVWYA